MSLYARFAAHYERVFPFRPATLAFLRARLPDTGRVLDLGCGPGHHAGALAAVGLEVLGLDLDPAMIDAARARHGIARFAVGDLGDVAGVADRADGAFCIGNVLPHLPPAQLDRFLATLARLLPPGAPWIVQTVNFDRLLPLIAPHDFPPLTLDGNLVFHRRYEPHEDGSVTFRTTLTEADATLFTGEAVLWPLTSDDLAARHRAADFELVEQAGGFAGEAYAPATSGGCIQVYRGRSAFRLRL